MMTNVPGTTPRPRPRSRKGNGTSQKVALALAAALAVFVVMVLGATMAYVAFGGASGAAALTSAGTAAASPPSQASAPSFPGTSDNQGVTSPGTTNLQDPGSGGSITGSGYPVSADQATSIALDSSPGATLAQQPQLVNVGGTVAYAVPLSTGYVLVDATSGQVLYNAATGSGQFGRGRRGFHRQQPQTP